jgi:chromosome segregation ATPase
MARARGEIRCATCDKGKGAFRCEGCQQLFCFDHLRDHREQLSVQLEHIEGDHDLLRQTLTEKTHNPQKHLLIKQIDQWEKDSINKIQQTAKECRQILLQHTTEYINQIEINLTKLTDQLRETRQENDFNEIDLNEFKQKLTQLTTELDKPSNISIQHDSTTLIKNISVIVSSFNSKCVDRRISL